MSRHRKEPHDQRPDEVALAPLGSALRRLGYEIEPERPGAPRGSELIARRDLGNRAILLTVDRVGRFRIDLTWQIGEWPSRQDLGETPVRVVDTVTRAVSIAGQVEQGARLLEIVADLNRIVPWAGATDDAGAGASPSESGTNVPPPP